MNNKQITQNKLQAELKRFGLNPSEWSLQRIQSLTYLVQNRLDRSFTFRGHLEFRQQKPQWKSLEVLSL